MRYRRILFRSFPRIEAIQDSVVLGHGESGVQSGSESDLASGIVARVEGLDRLRVANGRGLECRTGGIMVLRGYCGFERGPSSPFYVVDKGCSGQRGQRAWSHGPRTV